MKQASGDLGETSTASTAPRDGVFLDRVGKRFPSGQPGKTTEALRDVSLTVDRNTFMALLGPSGCGKTTVLRLIDGLIKPDSGTVRVFGESPKPGPGIGLVFQSFRLIPWMSVRNNVDFALREMDISAEARRERIQRHLELVGLSKSADVYPRELSGGMKQRVALARALAPEPRLLLMDEPFASIDAQARELMQIELMRIWMQRRPIVIFVTHSVDEAILLADRIALISPSPGHVAEIVDVDLERPRWHDEARADARFVELRRYLSQRMREFVFSDPTSEFYGRDPDVPRRG